MVSLPSVGPTTSSETSGSEIHHDIENDGFEIIGFGESSKQVPMNKDLFLNIVNRSHSSTRADGNCCLSSMYSTLNQEEKIKEAEKLFHYVQQTEVKKMFTKTCRESNEDYFKTLISSFISKVKNPENNSSMLSSEYWGNISVVVLAARSMKKDVVVVNLDSSGKNITTMSYYPYVKLSYPCPNYFKSEYDMNSIIKKISSETIIIEYDRYHYNAYISKKRKAVIEDIHIFTPRRCAMTATYNIGNNIDLEKPTARECSRTLLGDLLLQIHQDVLLQSLKVE